MLEVGGVGGGLSGGQQMGRKVTNLHQDLSVSCGAAEHAEKNTGRAGPLKPPTKSNRTGEEWREQRPEPKRPCRWITRRHEGGEEGTSKGQTGIRSLRRGAKEKKNLRFLRSAPILQAFSWLLCCEHSVPRGTGRSLNRRGTKRAKAGRPQITRRHEENKETPNSGNLPRRDAKKTEDRLLLFSRPFLCFFVVRILASSRLGVRI
jgi:hypothetical protein